MAQSESSLQTRNSDTGNPPVDETDQITRLGLIQNVLNRDYASLSKVNRGTYTVYLYLSHFVDNLDYLTTADHGFARLNSHTISIGDVEVYDSFMKVARYNNFVRQLSNLGTAAASLTSSFDSINDTIEIASRQTVGALTYVVNEAQDAGQSAEEIATAGVQIFDMAVNRVKIHLADGTQADALEQNVITQEVLLAFEGTANTGKMFEETMINTMVGAVLSTMVGVSPFFGIALGAVSVLTMSFTTIVDVTAILAMRQSQTFRVTQRNLINMGWAERPTPPNV